MKAFYFLTYGRFKWDRLKGRLSCQQHHYACHRYSLCSDYLFVN
ncbi:hypothetical protein VCRA2113O119_20005 [Vibrio crassostreae]|nr:hypothetical protein VCRA2113O119_20005 [Vibrio crassostreae]CAK2326327.1 hypothetical protein VCRA2112O114_310004 [Vibrio crassostreae]CAK3020699.1 hypothetical protein VCRA217O112_40005 [Vibrio crassostreae]CAK3165571.1 hypothetical protein VCRA2120E126_100182 [Vibrio crassostreae]CAK3409856.1 hypothetical protein VCRA2126E132_30006 [Vibrio crassostreae]